MYINHYLMICRCPSVVYCVSHMLLMSIVWVDLIPSDADDDDDDDLVNFDNPVQVQLT